MKGFTTLLLATLAIASPVSVVERSPEVDIEELIAAQALATGTTSKEFTQGGCRDIILFFARGTTEPGNMGSQVGPPLSNQLKSLLGDSRVAAEGVDYAALLITNLNPGGADYKGIAEMQRLINLAAAQCPNSKLVASGYSQGAALTHRALEKLPADVLAKVAAAVTFGDTQNKQDGGRIPNFAPDKTLIICNDGDDVCKGTLLIKPAHLDYTRRVPEAVSFIASKVR